MRDDLKRLAVGIAVLLLLVAGLLLWSRQPLRESAPATAAAAPPADEPARASQPLPAPANAPAKNTARAPAPPAQAVAASAAPEAATARADRIEFPANLPPAFTPAGFHDAVRRAIEACQFPLELTEEDCSEFPCIAWGKWSAESFGPPHQCDAWRDTFGEADIGFFYVDRNDLIPRVAVGAMLPGTSYKGVEMKHVKARVRNMMIAQGAPVADESEDDDSNDSQKRAPKPQRLASAH